jgi:protein-tyrosine phosphatase
MRVLFVCLGNICRSPLAEALFVHKVTARGVAHRFDVDSCATSNYNIGDDPDHRTRSNALRNGVAMEHKARQMKPGDFAEFDHILVMDGQNYRNVLAFSDPAHHHKVALVRHYDPMGSGDVPDPYWGTEDDFQHVFEMLDRTVENLLDHLLAPAD